jgi:hypothetical protein
LIASFRASIVLAAVCAAPALADEPPKPDAAAPPAPAQPAKPGELRPPLSIDPPGSSDDLNEAIAEMRPRHAGILPNGPVSIFDRFLDSANAKLDEALGLKFGLSYTTAYQRASDNTAQDKDTAAGDVDVFARWRFFGAESNPTRGVFGIYGEYRHDFGNPVPKDIAADVGSLWRTTNGYGTQDWELTQCWWEQHLADDKLVVTVGKLDADNFYNKARYQSDSKAFMATAFSSNPARGHPGNGLGGNALFQVAPEWYVTGGAQDANGAKSRSGFHTIDEGDFFYAGEVGWTPDVKGVGKGTYRLCVWHLDEADVEDNPEDKGINLSCDQDVGCGVFPFFRAAWSEGDATGVERFVAAGVGLEGVLRGKEDLTGIAFAWGDPAESSAESQFGGEIFHRFQLAPDVQLTIGYQYIVEPSYAPSSNDDPVGVFEVRVRIEF